MEIGPTRTLTPQVGGHVGVLTTENGSLLIKAALPRELEVYQKLLYDPVLEALRPFTATFLGTLKLEGEVDESNPITPDGGIAIKPTDDHKDDSIVLENVTYPFLKPNILDVKLGTILYDETASPEKVERMKKTARDTTSFETGVRLTGFQVYDNATSLPKVIPKSYGKSIKSSDLPDGISQFFPVGQAPNSSSGLPKQTLLPILRAIREDVADIREVFTTLEIRLVGGSLLIIYEADWARAEEGLQRLWPDEGDEGGPPFVVKIIDFAHTRLAPGEGPDEGVLLGLDTVLRLLDARIAQIEG
ncbi:uncharacterized protein LACBIDRAFT_246465 [Laccaria bicolor S238N-H82]|uniref:Kinase n=1 Tax=Laccaria bicolor (strain S238N-H82 / ATCC MYA-4686) TaxID=486041 RepID=B0CZM6_LACBS|nr:uncharacterized protein LACBIDRAFT_246465 [Laccaria bicolor S238N-H82]EDR12176.1 predicted protein [Laccaria bicolor S238N-H82]|eukprot:XP_001876440.1 predicted protein [Laccaria bicolor S238N-H82]